MCFLPPKCIREEQLCCLPSLLRGFLQVRPKLLMNVNVIIVYHRILKLDVITELIQPYPILLEKTKLHSDFLKYNMLAFFLLSLLHTWHLFFSTHIPLCTFFMSSIKFYFPHLFTKLFPQICLVHLRFLHATNHQPRPTGSPVPKF